MSDNALSQANAQMASIREMVAALECDYDRLEELRDDRDGYETEGVAGGAALRAAAQLWAEHNPDDAAELAELEAAAGSCTDEDDARTRIDHDALSVEVRSDWHAPGDSGEATEFRIVLCTGGPHVQMVGELSQGEPSRAWLEYQDWGTPMTERVNMDGDQDALLAYARCFYFGE